MSMEKKTKALCPLTDLVDSSISHLRAFFPCTVSLSVCSETARRVNGVDFALWM